MTHRARPPAVARWPFWLLLAAWVCANSPQAALHEVIDWVARARHFSHQHRLRCDVAGLLAHAHAVPLEVEAAPAAPRAPLPLVPAEAVFKRVDLTLQRTIECVPAARSGLRSLVTQARAPEARRAPPPHRPPRGASVA